MSNTELLTSFRQKAAFMKSWRPASTPSNRDRLELYAWHKQAVSGDAPSTHSSNNATEKAKYSAWRSKSGTESATAMRNYMTEAERQIRVYGSSNNHLPSTETAPEYTTTATPPQPSRGLAAIPLLCAAASEQRTAYLRRLQNTSTSAAWWKRQEPLTATPHTLAALPETILLYIASLVEHISLTIHHPHSSLSLVLGQNQKLPHWLGCVLQSALWPLHNVLLSIWMGMIVISSVFSSSLELTKTILLGSRRTGRTLMSIYKDDVVFCSTSVGTLTESHQPVSARVVGLVLQPLPIVVGLLKVVSQDHILWMSLLFSAFGFCTWWYWMLVLPWFFVVVMFGTAVLLGNCFGVIELASHL